MTVQEIFERDGYFVLGSTMMDAVGKTSTVNNPGDILEGTQVRVIGRTDAEDAKRQWSELGTWQEQSIKWPYFYKVIAE